MRVNAALTDGILYDPSLVTQPRHEWFEINHWQQQHAARLARGGRGNVVFIDAAIDGRQHHWVLRHYRRGGLIGKLINDQYLWLGADATRCVREWRLLAQLYAQGLPVPRPVAVRYVRSGISYRADLLTETITGARTLTECLEHSILPSVVWQAIGTTIARFHAAGVHHADLNAHNIVFDAQQAVILLDFDRGQVQPLKSRWVDVVLARLLRSLNKLQQQRGIHFALHDWQQLKIAHDEYLKQ
jgi:3-deoxy-D-manno-octulosonic acid kinase